MQESVTAPPTKEDLQESASALLDAIVRAEVELHALQERCGSLELAISLGREAVATAESLPVEAGPAKSTSGIWPEERSPASEEISPAPTPAMAPFKPPKPLSVPKGQPAKAARKSPEKAAEPEVGPELQPDPKPVLEPVAAATLAPETPESRAAASASLEEQAAALRAAMGAQSAPAAEAPPANASPTRRPEPTKTEAPPATAPDPVEHEPGPFKPKRSTPLKSRLAGLDVKAAETESESYSERSAELEQLLRSRDEG